ncbi:hypothetical protein CMI47_12430 [Candidatus Pacearchaeota archaeon]|nr:hypothetical protein [Candidatus Pacearchaeota archaeon]
MKDFMNDPKPKVFRLCFDFRSADDMISFWESFKDQNLVQEVDQAGDTHRTDGWKDAEMVHKDALHDQGKSVQEFLVRNKTEHAGNGRPVVYTEIPGTEPRRDIQKPGASKGLTNR